jgi:SAM-dependent MidA family methyltransferase
VKPLAERLIARVHAEGPMTLAAYMNACLLDPAEGYYATRDPFGAAGDFITSPEISQMFGELCGLALAQAWMDQGAPAAFNLVEPGPGRGTLMSDILRATKGVPGFHEAAQVLLIEASETLRQLQRETINHPFRHLGSISDVPGGPLYLIANEFFDALPIRQFQRTETAWRERLVGLSDGALSFGLGDETSPLFLEDRHDDTRAGDIVEICEPGCRIANEIGQRIARDGGVALLIDYGGPKSLGDTFQAVRGHQTVDPFIAPGTADLTAHVDFGALAASAAPAIPTPLADQGAWLQRLGIASRAEALARQMTETQLEQHIAGFRRLTLPEEMGTLFKVLGLHAPETPMPPGFTD